MGKKARQSSCDETTPSKWASLKSLVRREVRSAQSVQVGQCSASSSSAGAGSKDWIRKLRESSQECEVKSKFIHTTKFDVPKSNFMESNGKPRLHLDREFEMEIPSLVCLCVENISQNLQHYVNTGKGEEENEDLTLGTILNSFLTLEDSRCLSYYASRHQTINDDSIRSLACNGENNFVLSGDITYKGVKSLIKECESQNLLGSLESDKDKVDELAVQKDIYKIQGKSGNNKIYREEIIEREGIEGIEEEEEEEEEWESGSAFSPAFRGAHNIHRIHFASVKLDMRIFTNLLQPLITLNSLILTDVEVQHKSFTSTTIDPENRLLTYIGGSSTVTGFNMYTSDLTYKNLLYGNKLCSMFLSGKEDTGFQNLKYLRVGGWSFHPVSLCYFAHHLGSRNTKLNSLVVFSISEIRGRDGAELIPESIRELQEVFKVKSKGIQLQICEEFQESDIETALCTF